MGSSTQPVTKFGSNSAGLLTGKINTQMGTLRNLLDFPARQYPAIMRQRTEKCRQIPASADCFTGQTWSVFIPANLIRDGSATFELPLKLGPQDLMLTASERSEIGALRVQFDEAMAAANAAENNVKRLQDEARNAQSREDVATRKADKLRASGSWEAETADYQARQWHYAASRAEQNAVPYSTEARSHRAEAAAIDRQTEPMMRAARARKPASTLIVSGVGSQGQTSVEVLSVECVVVVADAEGLREVPVGEYDFGGHFEAGNDAAVIYRITARALEGTANAD